MSGILLPIGKSSRLPNGKFPHWMPARTIAGMQTVHETRRERLSQLLEKFGTYAAINEALEWPRTDSRLSRIKNANARTDRNGKVFQMGDAIAREIETKLGYPEGWMDTPPSFSEIHNTDDPRAMVISLMDAMPSSEWATVVRLVDALAKPAPKKANGS